MTTLDPIIQRCLANTPEGKANGCWRANDCWRHVAIRTDVFDGSLKVIGRKCAAGSIEFFTPLPEDGQA